MFPCQIPSQGARRSQTHATPTHVDLMQSASLQAAQRRANVQLDSKVIHLSLVRKESASMTTSVHKTWRVSTSTVETLVLEHVAKMHSVKFVIIAPFALVRRDSEEIL